MPIEIKELHIIVKVAEDKPSFQEQTSVNTMQLETLKLEIVRECVSKVLEKIKEKSER
jgi:Family of unknown function (DUF5908)